MWSGPGHVPQPLGDASAALRVAGHQQDGVVARDGAEDVGQAGPVDCRRQQVRAPRRGPRNDQVGARLDRDEPLRGTPRDPYLGGLTKGAQPRTGCLVAQRVDPPDAGPAYLHRADLLEVARQCRLRHLEAFRSEQPSQLRLRPHRVGGEHGGNP